MDFAPSRSSSSVTRRIAAWIDTGREERQDWPGSVDVLVNLPNLRAAGAVRGQPTGHSSG
jgi:hypothetical protein